MKYLLGTGKCTWNAVVYSETGLNKNIVEQWKAVGNHWHKTVCFRESTMNKNVFNWSINKKTKHGKN
jgi:hypothetical protein